MANKIQIKRGTKASLPSLDSGEMGYCVDTKELYVGNASGGNTKVAMSTEAAPVSHTHNANDISAGTLAAARLPVASTSAAGIVQLNSTTNSTSTTQAATASAVNSAYDLAAGKLGPGVTWNQLKGV